MAWTVPTGLFFAGIAGSLVVMTVWESLRPTAETRGFLPIVTTRGDRFFIGLLSTAFIHMLWLGISDGPLLIASAISVVWGAALMRWG